MKDIKKAALWGGLVAAGTVVGLACYVCYLGKKTDTNKKTIEFVYPKLEETKGSGEPGKQAQESKGHEE